MKKETMVKSKSKRTKNIKAFTLVGEFLWKEIYIAGELSDAKNFSKFMEMWMECISIIENNKSLDPKSK